MKQYWKLARPFTLLPPVIGIISGSAVARGALHVRVDEHDIIHAAIAAAILNAGSNAINQIYDLELDRVNKPHRPIPSGALTIRQAGWFAVICYVLALLFASTINVACAC